MEGMPVSGPKLPEIGDEIAGKYRIASVLGQGGMGTVFSAENLLTGKRVAIKWLLPEHATCVREPVTIARSNSWKACPCPGCGSRRPAMK